MLVMTFNLRFATPLDGPNEWEQRKDLAVEVIRRQAPDLLATQEGTTAMLRFLEAELTEYRPLTAQRPVDETCQYPTIFYRAGRFTVHESREFWLSQTPEVHRSCRLGQRLSPDGHLRPPAGSGAVRNLLLDQYPPG